MIKKLTIFAIIVLLQFSAYSQEEVHKLNSKTIKDLALQENVQIQNAKADIRISKKKVWETTAIGLPQADASLSYNKYIDIPTTLVPAQMFDPTAEQGEFIPLQFGTEHNATFQFQASQLIFSGEYIVGLQAAKTYKFLSQQNLNKTEDDVLSNVYQTYYTLLFAKKNLEILRLSEKDMQKTYDETKQIYQAGLMDETSVNQLELNLKSMKNNVSSMERQLKVQEKLLKFQIGVDISDSIYIQETIDNVFASTGVEQAMLTKLDVSENIDYQLLKTQEQLQELNIKREKSKSLPTVSAFYNHQQSGQGNEFDFYKDGDNWFPANIVGGSLNVPILSSGSRISKIQQQQIELEKIKNNQYQLEQSLLLNIERTKTDLINAYETYLKEKDNMELAKNIYEKGKVKFKEGTISSTEITQLNIQYLTSQISYYSAKLDVLNKKLAIDKITGNL